MIILLAVDKKNKEIFNIRLHNELNYNMATSVLISDKSLDLSNPTPLTNEIPHMGVYNILNQHLRNDWSRELLGTTRTYYNREYEAIKVMNGVQSENYKPRNIQFTDVGTNQIYNVSFGKINFDVDGAFETEMDYLTHEMTRYLSKLYSDDYNTLITLTAAERQSYFNEALHMIHSYFDTEQIQSSSDIEDLYLKNKFITGITTVRSYTGVSTQEELLIKLITSNDTKIYTGFTQYVSIESNTCISNEFLDEEVSLTFNTSYFTYHSKETCASQLLQELNGKISQDNLIDFVKAGIQFLNVGEVIEENFRPYHLLPVDDLRQLLLDVLDGNSYNHVNINKWAKLATERGIISGRIPIDTFKRKPFGEDTFLSLGSEEPMYLLAKVYNGATNLVPLREDGTSDTSYIISLRNKIITTHETFEDLNNLQIFKLGNYTLSRDYKIALGNLIYGALTNITANNSEAYKTLNTFIKSANNFQLVVTVRDTDERVLFKGFLNKDYLKTKNLTQAVRNTTQATFEEEYSLDNIIASLMNLNDVPDLDFTVNTLLDFQFEALIFKDPEFPVHRQLYKIKQNDFGEEGKIFFKVNENFVDVRFECLTGPLRQSIYFTGTTQQGVLTSDYVSDQFKLELSINNRGLYTVVITAKDWSTQYIIDPEARTIKDNKGNEGQIFLYQDCEIPEFNDFIDELVFTEQLRQSGQILENRVYSISSFDPTAQLTVGVTTNIVELEISNVISLQRLIELNTQISTVLYTSELNTYIYAPEYIVSSSELVLDTTSIAISSLASYLFLGVTLSNLYNLQTYPCQIISDNLLKLGTDIREITDTYGKLYVVLIDNYQNRYFTRIINSYVKNEYCYVQLEEKITGLSDLSNPNCYLCLDLKYHTDIEHPHLEIERPTVATRRIFLHQRQYYIYNYEWVELKQEHLNYLFDNLYTKTVEDFADDQNISIATKVPKSLSELQSVAVLDIDVANDTLLQLINNLIEENKSLYLDSTIMTLRHIPLNLHNLIYNERYQTWSYTNNASVPAYVHYYYVEDLQFKPLQDLLDADLRELTIDDINALYSRRFIVWGNVIWDANDVSRSVRNLRTIWSGFFTNFEIYQTSDLLPDEGLLTSQVDSKSLYFTDIINYQYSDNQGLPDLEWKLALSPKITSRNTKTIDWVENKDTPEEPSVNKIINLQTKIRLHKIVPETFYVSFNKLSETSDLLNLATGTYNVDLISLAQPDDPNDFDLSLHIVDAGDLKFKWDSNSYKYNATLDRSDSNKENLGNYTSTQYELSCIYNQVHLKEVNDQSIGLYNQVGFDDVYLEMILEAYTACYLDTKSEFAQAIKDKHKDLPADYIPYYLSRFYLAQLVEEARQINFVEFLDFLCNQIYYIPCVAVLDQESNLTMYAYRFVKTDQHNYRIIRNVFVRPFNSDLLNSLLGGQRQFQLKDSYKNTFSTYSAKYQTYIPENFTGKFVDLNMVFDEEASQKYFEQQFSQKEDLIKVQEAFQELLKTEPDNLKDVCNNYDIVENNKLQDKDKKYTLSTVDKYFREYTPVTAQLTTAAIKDESCDIETCIMHFNKDLQLKPKGYLYMYDITASDRRSSYSVGREIQIVDRSHTITDLHALAFQETENALKFLLQDSTRTITSNVLKVIEAITPKDKNEITQQVTNDILNFGVMWPDPGVEVDYTYYKRKFMAEVKISGSDTTHLTLSDPDLNSDKGFSLLDHMEVGDQIHIMLLDDVSSNAGAGKLTIGNNGNEYVGPYQIIYKLNTTTISAEPVQKIVLAGPNNIVYVEINLEQPNIQISKPFWIKGRSDQMVTPHIYAFEQQGEIVYYDDISSSILGFCNVDLYMAHATDIGLSAAEITSGYTPGSPLMLAVTVPSISVADNLETTLISEHSEWKDFNKTTGVDTLEELDETTLDSFTDETDIPEDQLKVPETSKDIEGEPTTVFASIKLNSGTLNIDNFDRMFFKPDAEDEESVWSAQYAEAEQFDASGIYNGIEVLTDNNTAKINIKIETATKDQLLTFIRDKLTAIFNNAGTDAAPVYSTKANDLVEPVDVSLYSLACKVLGTGTVAKETTFNLKTCAIYLPQFKSYDMPVYFKQGQDAKWLNQMVITGASNINIANADLEDLKKFARVINPVNIIVRKAPKITSYAKNSRNLVLWDQNSGALTITDKVGTLKKRIALSSIGYNNPVMNVIGSKGSDVYSLSSKIYIADKTNIDLYKQKADSYIRVTVGDKSYGIYEVFQKGNPLYLPTIFSSVTKASLAGKFGNDELAIEKAWFLIEYSKNESQYNTYWNNCIRINYLATDGNAFTTFKDPDAAISMSQLSLILKELGKTDEKKILDDLSIEWSDGSATLIKGTPYHNLTTFESLSSNGFGEVTSVGTPDTNMYSFESMITSSGIELTDNAVHIYGTLKTPTYKDINEKIWNGVRDVLSADSRVSKDELDSKTNVIVEDLKNEILYKLKAFGNVTTLEYEKEYQFKCTVDLDTYWVTNINLSALEGVVEGQMTSLKSTNEGMQVLTDKGTFDLGDPSAPYVSDPSGEVDKTFNLNKGIIQVYDALKNLDSFGDIELDSNGITINVKSVVVQTADNYYSIVSQINDKDLFVQDDMILMDEDREISAVIFVKSSTKDNFQFGYGEITNLEYIQAAQTLFEVPSSSYADFASYDNSHSNYIQSDISGVDILKPQVFDTLYPTWEVIEEGQRQHFYETEKGQLKYLINSAGRALFRITPVISNASGGQMIYRKSEKPLVLNKTTGLYEYTDVIDKNYERVPGTGTVANEGIDSRLIAEMKGQVGEFVMSDLRTYRKDYISCRDKLLLQKIPAMTLEPRNAVVEHAYKINKIKLDSSSEKSNVEVYDDYLILTVAKEGDSVAPEFYQKERNSTFDIANKLQFEKVVNKQLTDEKALLQKLEAIGTQLIEDPENEELLQQYKDEEDKLNQLREELKANLQKDDNTKFIFDVNGNYVADANVDTTAFTTVPVENDKTTQLDVRVQTMVSANTSAGIYDHNYAGPLAGVWNIFQQNVSLNDVDLKIINQTDTLPKFRPITGFSSKNVKSNQVIDTDCYEMFIPEQGYGQSLIGSYTLPNEEEHRFENKVFFDFGGSTVNRDEKGFILVDENLNVLQDNVPKLMYKSFQQANSVLDMELATKEPIDNMVPALVVDMSQLDVGSQVIQVYKLATLDFINFAKASLDNNEARLYTYNLFQNDIQFSCKLAYSEYSYDVNNTDHIFEVSEILKGRLDYTRVYQNYTVPINYKYQKSDGTYVRTTKGALKDRDRLAVDDFGNILYMRKDGDLTTTPTVNPPIPASKSVEKVIWLQSTDGNLESILSKNFFLTKTALKVDYNTSHVIISDIGNLRALIAEEDVNIAYTPFSSVSNENWLSSAKFKWQFTKNQIVITFENANRGKFNYVFLYDKSGRLVAKTYFHIPIRPSDLLYFDLTN